MTLRRIKLWVLAVAVAAVLAATASPAAALKPTSAFYVNDYVGIFSQPRADYLTQRGSQLYQQNGVQVVAVTGSPPALRVSSLSGLLHLVPASR